MRENCVSSLLLIPIYTLNNIRFFSLSDYFVFFGFVSSGNKFDVSTEKHYVPDVYIYILRSVQQRQILRRCYQTMFLDLIFLLFLAASIFSECETEECNNYNIREKRLKARKNIFIVCVLLTARQVIEFFRPIPKYTK